MRVRLIAGEFGGRRLYTPRTRRTHPMSERARSALFNSIFDEVVDAKVLDAFAGTGAIGLEAISRGCMHTTFVEKDRVAAKALRQNVEALRLEDARAKVVQAPVSSWSGNNADEQFDIIFADPPYWDMQFSTVEKLFKHLKPGALMVLSYTGRGEDLPGAKGIVVVDVRSYSGANLAFFRREE